MNGIPSSPPRPPCSTIDLADPHDVAQQRESVEQRDWGERSDSERQDSSEPRERFSLSALINKVPGMNEVNELVRAKFTSDSPLLREIPEYLFALGGKRIRPLITLLTARACGMSRPTEALVDVAAGIELIHMATLLHDDIIDRSPMRRHRESPYSRYGLISTLLSGDFLLTRAFRLCARLDSFIIDATEAACIALTEGEIAETPLSHEQHTLDSSLEIARKKTAALFTLACQSGSHLAGASPSSVAAFASFGESLGIAFQIVDDLLDVVSSEEVLGKRTGLDIIERKPSIVNVLWLASGDPRAAVLRSPASDCSEETLREYLQAVRSSSAPAQTRALAEQYARRAEQSLERALAEIAHPDALAVKGLRAVINAAIERMA